MKPPFRARLDWAAAPGAVMDETRRYLLMRPEALMGMMRRLSPSARAEALAALRDAVIEMGGDSARAYRSEGADPEALMATVARTAPDLGWGRWSFSRSNDGVVLDVSDSPFAAGFGPSEGPVCAAISGMATAVARLVLEDDLVLAHEVDCAAAGAPCCRFQARRAHAFDPIG